MADQIHPDDELNELASAYLDGALPADERVLVEAEPEAMLRVQALASVRAHLAVPVAVDAAQREAHIAAALGVHLEPAVVAPPVAPPVADLAAARARRSKRWMPALSAAAAVVLIAGIGLSIAGRGDDDAGGEAATVNEPQAQPAFEAASATTAAAATTLATSADGDQTAGSQKASPPPETERAAEDAAADEMVATAAAPLSAPVEVASDEELTAVVDDALTQQAASMSAAAPTCADHEGEVLMELTWQGIGALLFVIPTLSAPESAVVVDASTCTDLVAISVP